MKYFVSVLLLLVMCGGAFGGASPGWPPPSYVIQQQWQNVKDYGAKGDGTTDDLAAFVAAADAAGNKGIIFVPSGTFLLSDTFNLHGDSVTLCGVGVASVIKADSGHNENIITIVNKTGVVVRDLMIDGNNANNDSLRTAIIFEGSTNFRVSNITIVNMYGQGVGVGTEGNPSSNFWIENCTILGGTGNNIDINSSQKGNVLNNTITGIGTGVDGIFLGHGLTEDHLVMGNKVSDVNMGIAVATGMFINDTSITRRIRIIGNYFANNLHSGIYLRGVSNSIIANNECIGNNVGEPAGSGIYLTDAYPNEVGPPYSDTVGCTHNIIIGNRCYDTAGFQLYGIETLGKSDSNYVMNNNFSGNAVGDYLLVGDNNVTYLDTAAILYGNLWNSYEFPPEIHTYISAHNALLVMKADSAQLKFVEQHGRFKLWIGDSAFANGIPWEVAAPGGLNLPYIYMQSDTTRFRGNVIIDSPLTVGVYKLPIVDGTVDQVLTTSGSGVLAWNTQAGAGGGEANTIQDTGVYNGTEGFGLAGGKAGVDLHVKGLIEGSNVTITTSGDSGLSIAASGGGDGLDTTEVLDILRDSISGDATVGAQGAITITTSAIDSTKIAPNSVKASELANDAVLSGHILDGQIISDDMADSAIGVGKIDHSDAETNWLDAVYQPLEATLTDIADGIIDENLDNTINPWAANEIVSTVIHNDEMDASSELLAIMDDETGTGVLVFATAPTFTTDITVPLVIGGTGTTSDLSLKTTSGVGATGADMHFLVGNNGATEAMTILNNGNVGVGINSPSSALHIKADIPGTVGSHSAGQLIIQNPTNSVFSNAVITGYESDAAGNPDQQLWYLGSASVSNSDVLLLNRRASNLHLGTNDATQLTIDADGNVIVSGTVDGVDLAAFNTDVAADSGSWNATADAFPSHFDSAEVVDTIQGVITEGGYITNSEFSDSSITLLNATAWRLFYSNATTTAIQELALGGNGTYLKSNGASANPTWATPSGSGIWVQSTDSAILVDGDDDTTMHISDNDGGDVTWTIGADQSLLIIEVDTIVHSGVRIGDFEGTNLSVTDGVLNASGGSGVWTERSDTMFLVDTDGDTLAAFWDDDAGNVWWQVATEDQTLKLKIDSLDIGGTVLTDLSSAEIYVAAGQLRYMPLAIQAVHVDSIDVDFIFYGAYHVTSATEDSAYITANTVNDTADVLRAEMDDSAATHAGDTADAVRSEFPTPKYMFNLADPDALYATDHEWSIDPLTERAITIDSFRVTLDADPTTELTFSLKFADAFIGFANATVIDDTATVAGVTIVTGGFGDATVPANKCIYLLFDADPDDAITQASFKIYYTFD